MSHCAGIKRVVAVCMTAALALACGLPGAAAAGDLASMPSQPTLVQFRSFMAPITRAGAKKPCLKAVTVIVEVDESEAVNVCSSMPRIRDAVLVELFREPIAVDRRAGMDVQPVEIRLLGPVNRALGNVAVRRVYVIPGAEHMTQATAARLPYPIVGCRPPRNRKA